MRTTNQVVNEFTYDPDVRAAPAIREELQLEIDRGADNNNVKCGILSVLLFKLGDVRDSLLIWKAKTSSYDSSCTVDVQLLCGAGLEETKKFLSDCDEPEADSALEYIVGCEKAGDFNEFSVDAYASYYISVYDGLDD